MRALSSQQCGSGSITAWCHMWVEFVVGYRLAQRVFLRVLKFSSLHKKQHSKLQFDRDRDLVITIIDRFGLRSVFLPLLIFFEFSLKH